MAQSCASLFFLSLLLLAIANPRAHATFGFLTSQGVSVSGNLCCTQNGNCPGPAVTGAVVTLSCPSAFSGTVVVGQNTTDVNGFFNITTLAPSGAITSLPSLCLVSVQLPLSSVACPVLAGATGVLDGILQVVGTLVTQAIGIVQAARVSIFVRV